MGLGTLNSKVARFYDFKSSKETPLHPGILPKKVGSFGCESDRIFETKRCCRSKESKPQATGFQRGLYELKGFERVDAQQVEETFFKPLDTMASKSLDLIESEGVERNWDSENRSHWSRFILSLMLRCPEDIIAFRNWWQQNFEKFGDIAEDTYQRTRRPHDPKTASEFLADQPEQLREKYLFEVFCSLINHEAIGRNLNNMKWRVVHFLPHTHTLLTSDRPVIMSKGLHGEHMALPIGPRSLFVGSHGLKKLGQLTDKDKVKLAKDTNRQITEAASRFVYSIDQNQTRFIQNHFGKNPTPRLIDWVIRHEGG